MSFNTWLNEKVHKLDWMDISLIKLSVIFFTLFLAKQWEAILAWDWATYLILALLFSLRPYYRAYISDGTHTHTSELRGM